MKKIAAVAVAGAVTAVLTACGPGDGSGVAASSASSRPSAGATSPAGSAAPSTVLTSPQADPQAAFTPASIRLEGPNYTIDVPQVNGGNAAARAEFNDGMGALAGEWIAQLVPGTSITGGESKVVHIGTHVLSGELVVIVYAQGAAHPNNFYATHVTNVDTGQPITLTNLFTDTRRGLEVLSAQAALLVPKTRAGADFRKEAIAPEVRNYENWLATPEGMRIVLGEIGPHALGKIEITVPWSELDGVLQPGMRAIVSS
ncbi:RsiV family protein [Nocardia sp. GCM10030253]|uniref:RsiV family protein n=1 Tax=Nocardia sp. GCM10030253 TaxID=3273404 RepID=UPI00362B29AA